MTPPFNESVILVNDDQRREAMGEVAERLACAALHAERLGVRHKQGSSEITYKVNDQRIVASVFACGPRWPALIRFIDLQKLLMSSDGMKYHMVFVCGHLPTKANQFFELENAFTNNQASVFVMTLREARFLLEHQAPQWIAGDRCHCLELEDFRVIGGCWSEPKTVKIPWAGSCHSVRVFASPLSHL